MSIEHDLHERIKTLVNGCDCPDGVKYIFLEHITNAPASALQAFLDLFSDDTEDLSRFIERAVQKHIARGDVERTKELIEQDTQELKALLADTIR